MTGASVGRDGWRGKRTNLESNGATTFTAASLKYPCWLLWSGTGFWQQAVKSYSTVGLRTARLAALHHPDTSRSSRLADVGWLGLAPLAHSHAAHHYRRHQQIHDGVRGLRHGSGTRVTCVDQLPRVFVGPTRDSEQRAGDREWLFAVISYRFHPAAPGGVHQPAGFAHDLCLDAQGISGLVQAAATSMVKGDLSASSAGAAIAQRA